MADLNILYASYETLSHAGLRNILMKGGGVEKLDNAVSKEDLADKFKENSYDLLIIDFSSDSFFSNKDIISIQKEYPTLKFLIVSSENNYNNVLELLESGINGCVTLSCSEDEIISAVFSIAKGEKFFCNKVVDVILNKHLYQKEEDCTATILSEREAEIAGLIASGLTNKEIASQLFLSAHTIHTHRKNIMRKLKLKSVSELTVYAINTGLYHPN